MRKLVGSAALAAIVFCAQPARAQGGPPLITDDPDTPGPGFWEINLAAIVAKYHSSHSADLPRIDANYGVGRRMQLKFEAPWVRAQEDGEVRTGAGNAIVGVKYRFLGQEGRTIAWSTYPQVELGAPRASVEKGIADEGQALFLPTEITIEKARVEINGEVGRRFAHGGDDSWEYGISTEGHVVPRLELLGELHVETVRGAASEVIVNVGARPKITKRLIALLAAGRAVHGEPETRPRFLFYCGVQFNLPGQYSFAAQTPR